MMKIVRDIKIQVSPDKYFIFTHSILNPVLFRGGICEVVGEKRILRSSK